MLVHTYQTTRRRIPVNNSLHRLRTTYLTCHHHFICYVESALVFVVFVVYIAALLECGW